MQVNLNRPRIDDAGMLTGAELEEARRTNPGTVWQPRRHILLQCPPCNGDCCQGRCCPADACATEGGQHADPVPSGTHRQSALSRAWLRLVRWLT